MTASCVIMGADGQFVLLASTFCLRRDDEFFPVGIRVGRTRVAYRLADILAYRDHLLATEPTRKMRRRSEMGVLLPERASNNTRADATRTDQGRL